ncbi:MAG: DUF1707 domain-containing protein [Candidatus Nanopelagicales bacterium]
MSEPLPDRVPDRVNDALRLRASDADREKVAGLLRDAFAEGRLSPVEHDERLSEVYAATTYGDLLPLLADLPLAPGSFTVPGAGQVVAVSAGQDLTRRDDDQVAVIDTTRVNEAQGGSFAFMSETKKHGRIILPPDSSQVAVMGNVELDLSAAVLTSVETTIQTFAIMGAIKVVVPEGVHVVVDVQAIMGNAVEPPRSDPPAGAPVMRIKGLAFMGEVKVERTLRRELGR